MPPDFQLRRHRRARRLTLRVRPDASLLVTAPPGVGIGRIRAFIDERADWIEHARSRVEQVRAARAPDLNTPFPERIRLAAIERTIEVRYTGAANGRPGRFRGPNTLVLAKGQDADRCRAQLVDTLRNLARSALEPRVTALAAAHEIRFGRVGWRNQSSRWGSCSSKGNLSLNVRLLLLAPATVDYVICHELAHIDIPNHSSAFWKRVESMCPDYMTHERCLAEAARQMPVWVTG